MRTRLAWSLPLVFLTVALLSAQTDSPDALFRHGNENAARSRWDDAVADYSRLAESGVRAPSLYWNWAQAASASGRKGEALWAVLRARDLTPTDSSMIREAERLRGELGLDPSEVSQGLLGDLRLLARRYRFDGLAIAAFLLSMALLPGGKPRIASSRWCLLLGILLALPSLLGPLREPRGVVVRKDAPLLDASRSDAVALASLREGEVVPLLGEEGDFVRIQDASGARGFAHKNDVRKVGMP
jgi:hypothetical protein